MTNLVQEESQNMTDTGNPPPEEQPPSPPEPIFNVPIVALVLPIVIIAAYALSLSGGRRALIDLVVSFGLNPVTVRSGGWELLFTYMFFHGSWSGVLVNAAFILVCGTSLARAMGKGLPAVASYLLFYLICGIAAGLGFCLLHLYDNITVIGASGAMCGLLGAAVRLPVFNEAPGRVKSLFHPRVLGMTVFICLYSAIIAFTHGSAQQPRLEMAWEGHLAGYFVGLLLVGPWLKVFHHRDFTTN